MSSSSRQNCAQKVKFFHSFFITLHGKFKDWFQLKKMFWEIFFSSLYTPWNRSRSRQNWEAGSQSRKNGRLRNTAGKQSQEVEQNGLNFLILGYAPCRHLAFPVWGARTLLPQSGRTPATALSPSWAHGPGGWTPEKSNVTAFKYLPVLHPSVSESDLQMDPYLGSSVLTKISPKIGTNTDLY